MFPNFFSPFPFVSAGVLLTVVSLLTVVIHFAFAFGIKEDGLRLEQELRGPLFVKPVIWALATLIMGLPVVAFYWLVHHSAMSAPPRKP